MLEITLLLLIVFSIGAIQTHHLRHSVIYLGIFSLCISFAYLLYNAPDVALAEAIIGSTISTILYLVALQKYKIFTIYFKTQDINDCNTSKNCNFDTALMKLLDKFCNKQELESQFIFSSLSLDEIFAHHQYALIIENLNEDEIIIHAHNENFKLESLESFLIEEYTKPYTIQKVEEEIIE